MRAASTHDSQVFEELLADTPDGDPKVWADSAYRCESTVKALRKHNCKLRNNYKARRGKPLSKRQVELNKTNSKVRSRVEHVFGSTANEMPQRHMRCIGMAKART